MLAHRPKQEPTRPIVALPLLANLKARGAVRSAFLLRAPTVGLFDGRREASEAVQRVDGQIGPGARSLLDPFCDLLGG